MMIRAIALSKESGEAGEYLSRRRGVAQSISRVKHDSCTHVALDQTRPDTLVHPIRCGVLCENKVQRGSCSYR